MSCIHEFRDEFRDEFSDEFRENKAVRVLCWDNTFFPN